MYSTIFMLHIKTGTRFSKVYKFRGFHTSLLSLLNLKAASSYVLNVCEHIACHTLKFLSLIISKGDVSLSWLAMQVSICCWCQLFVNALLSPMLQMQVKRREEKRRETKRSPRKEDEAVFESTRQQTKTNYDVRKRNQELMQWGWRGWVEQMCVSQQKKSAVIFVQAACECYVAYDVCWRYGMDIEISHTTYF